MPDRYPHFWGGTQICTQSAPPVKGTNGEKLKMLNCKFGWISDPSANTCIKTPVFKTPVSPCLVLLTFILFRLNCRQE